MRSSERIFLVLWHSFASICVKLAKKYIFICTYAKKCVSLHLVCVTYTYCIMKKIISLTFICVMSLLVNAQNYVDLGLPSGTKWSSENEKIGMVTSDKSVVIDLGESGAYWLWDRSVRLVK